MKSPPLIHCIGCAVCAVFMLAFILSAILHAIGLIDIKTFAFFATIAAGLLFGIAGALLYVFWEDRKIGREHDPH